MFTPPLQRLAWKETRTVAVLWIMLLVATLILQTLIPAIYEFSQIRYTQQLFVLAYVLAACFGITAAAVLFAGEHEEGTLPFLRQLPIPPRDLLIAKFGVVLMGTLLFLLITLAFAAITDRLHLLSQRYNSDEEMALQFRDSLFGFLAWGIFFSLTSTHVLRVLVSAVAAEGLSVFLIWNVIFDRNFSVAGNIAYFSLVGAIAAVDAWLAWHWVHGRQVATIAEQIDRESVGTVRQSRWQRVLIRITSNGSPFTRQLGVLAWLEVRRAASFVLRWWAVGLLILIGITMPPTNGAGEFFIACGFYPFLFFTPLACGLFVAQNEQRTQSMTFLGDRGVPPAAVWWVRQVLWFSLSVLTTLLFLATAYGTGALRHALPRTLGTVDALGMFLRLISGTISNHCFLFVIGQLSAFWFRQTIVAWVVALLLGIGSLLWHVVMWHASVPLLVGVWPVGITWLLATLWSMNSWLGGETRRRIVLRRAAWFFTPLLLTPIFVIAVRLWQVPYVEIGYTAAEAERELQRVDRSLSAELTRLTDRANGLLDRDRRGQSLSDDDRSRMVRDIRAILPRLQQGSAFSYPPTDVASTSDVSQIRRRTGHVSLQDRSGIAVWMFLTKEFERLMTERKLDEALDLCFTMRELTQGFAVQQLEPDAWNDCIEQQEAVWNFLARWANDPDQTAERLEKARAWWVNRQRWFALDPEPMLHRWYGALSMSLRFDGPLMDIDPRTTQITRWTARSLLALTGESRRLDRLFRIAVFGSQRVTSGELHEYPFVQDHSTVFYRHSIHHPWSDSTFAWPPFDHTFRELVVAHSMSQEERTAQQAALLTILLQLHRHKTGTFPEHLTQLGGVAADISLLKPLFDPRAPNQFPFFEYAPQGYPVPIVLDLGVILPAGQPVLSYLGNITAKERLKWYIDPPTGKQWLSLSRNSPQEIEYYRRRLLELDLEAAEKNSDQVSFFSVNVSGRHSIAWEANRMGWNSR